MDKIENHINDMEHKEEINNPSEQQGERRIQKNEDSISSLWDDFNRSNIRIIRMLRELHENLNSIKKDYSEMKDILIEIKDKLQGSK